MRFPRLLRRIATAILYSLWNAGIVAAVIIAVSPILLWALGLAKSLILWAYDVGGVTGLVALVAFMAFFVAGVIATFLED